MCLKLLSTVAITNTFPLSTMRAAIHKVEFQKLKASMSMTEHLVALTRSNPIHTSFTSVT
jgi:hypothetical protein